MTLKPSQTFELTIPSKLEELDAVHSMIEQAARALPDVGIPQEIGRILQGTLLLSAVIAFEVVRRYGQAAAVRDAAAKADALERQVRLGVATL